MKIFRFRTTYFAAVVMLLLSSLGFVEETRAAFLNGSTFKIHPTNTTVQNFQYGVGNFASGNSRGTSMFESTGGNGKNLFVYFRNNATNGPTALSLFARISSVTNLPSSFPLIAMPTIRSLIPGSDRVNVLYSEKLNATAPSGGLFISSWNSNSFSLGVTNNSIAAGAVVGYEISFANSATVAAVPEPTSAVVFGIGLVGFVFRRIRRKLV